VLFKETPAKYVYTIGFNFMLSLTGTIPANVIVPAVDEEKLLNFNKPTAKFILFVAIKLNLMFLQLNFSSWTYT
jgi:hypothetical protein